MGIDAAVASGLFVALACLGGVAANGVLGWANLLRGVRSSHAGCICGTGFSMSVSTYPGLMQLTRTPNGDHSTASALVIPSTAAFAAV